MHCFWYKDNNPQDELIDEPLPECLRDKLESLKASLQGLHQLTSPRSYARISWRDMTQREVYVNCDASKIAITAVAFS